MRTLIALSLAAMFSHDLLAATLIEIGEGRAWIAREGRIEEWTRNGLSQSWEGPALPAAMLHQGNRTIVSGIDGELVVVDHHSGVASSVQLQQTVTEMIATPHGVVLLEGASGEIHLLREHEAAPLTSAGADAADGRYADGSLYLYSRAQRTISRVSLDDGSSVIAPLSAVPSDLEVDQSGVYVTYPEEGAVEVFDRISLASRERFRIGSAPVDLALASSSSLASGGSFVVADPAAGAVIRDERSRSVVSSFLRGFLRGLLGIGLARAEVFRPDGRPDHVRVGRSVWAQDSASGKIWRIDGKQIAEIGIAPAGAFAVSERDSAAWIDRASGQIRWYDPD